MFNTFKKQALPVLVSLAIAGCASHDVIFNKIYSTEATTTFTGDVCFDIGRGIFSNAITDDYWEALDVKNGIDCTKAIANRKQMDESHTAEYILASLGVSSRKTFLSEEVLTAIDKEIVTQQEIVNGIKLKEEEKHLEQQNQPEQNLRSEEQRKQEQIQRLRIIAKEMLGSYADSPRGAHIMHLSICLDASFRQGLEVFTNFNKQWEFETGSMHRDSVTYFEDKGRDFRKKQMSEASMDRDTIRAFHWYSFDCKTLM